MVYSKIIQAPLRWWLKMGSKASGDVYFVLAEERSFQAERTAQRRQAHPPPPNGLCLGRNSNSGQTSNSSEMGHRVTRGQSMTSLAVPLWEKAGKWSLSIIFLTSHWSGGCLQKVVMVDLLCGAEPRSVLQTVESESLDGLLSRGRMRYWPEH